MKGILRTIAALLALSQVGACAHVSGSAAPDSQVALASSTAGFTGGTAPSPKLSPEQALLRLLELLRSSRTIADFTPEQLSKVMGVKVEFAMDGSDRYGFGEAITPQWELGFGVDRASVHGAFFDFSFQELPRGSTPPMTDICQIDFDRFTAELEAMGFSRERVGGLHGGLGWDVLHRHGMSVEVYPRGEGSEPTELISHDCIKMIYVR